MDLILAHSTHRYWWSAIEDAREFRPPATRTPYTCLLWDTVGTWSDAARGALIDALLDSGCRYIVCGGETCEQWHDDVDELLAVRAALGSQEQSFVGTTWHTGERPEEVTEFFILHADVSDADIGEHLLLQLGSSWDVQNELMMSTRSWAVHPEGLDPSDSAG